MKDSSLDEDSIHALQDKAHHFEKSRVKCGTKCNLEWKIMSVLSPVSWISLICSCCRNYIASYHLRLCSKWHPKTLRFSPKFPNIMQLWLPSRNLLHLSDPKMSNGTPYSLDLLDMHTILITYTPRKVHKNSDQCTLSGKKLQKLYLFYFKGTGTLHFQKLPICILLSLFLNIHIIL